jgi:hypothetical protein
MKMGVRVLAVVVTPLVWGGFQVCGQDATQSPSLDGGMSVARHKGVGAIWPAAAATGGRWWPEEARSKGRQKTPDSAQSSTEAWRYTLLPGSQLLDECPDCDRLSVPQPLSGGFSLRMLADTPPFALYAVEEICLAAGSPGGAHYEITGKGIYAAGGEVARMQGSYLELWIDDGVSKTFCGFTNSDITPARLWPMLQLHFDQTNGTRFRTFHLMLAAAPFREIWFSIAQSLTAGIWSEPTNRVSAGDLLSSAGRVVRRNQELVGGLGVMPPVPDLGLDGAAVLAGGEISFSMATSTFSESLGILHDGDLLSGRGRMVRTYANLLAPFSPGLPLTDPGLDAVQVVGTNEYYFSVKTPFFSERMGRTIGRGDLLSSEGSVVKSNAELVAQFHPLDPAKDYGLDAVCVWPSGEVWFSVEDGFYGQHFDWYGAGDILSDQGYVVYKNLDLVTPFDPLEDLADFGLDALCLLSDASSPPSPAPIAGFEVDLFSGGLVLTPPSTNGIYQLERAASVEGPWQPVGPVSVGAALQDSGALTNLAQGFYRLRAW